MSVFPFRDFRHIGRQVVTASPLRLALDKVIAEHGCSMKSLTVLAPQNDPFRIDTPARHRDGEWLAITAASSVSATAGFTCAACTTWCSAAQAGRQPYANTEADWDWLQGDAGKAARWLGYIPFEQITDQRNAEPLGGSSAAGTLAVPERPA